MFGMSPWHLAILVVVALFVFGPERLPSMIKDLGKALRQVRAQAQAMQEDIKAELGPEVGDLDLRSLHPRAFVEKHLFGEDEDPLGLKGLRDDANKLVSFDKDLGDDLEIDPGNETGDWGGAPDGMPEPVAAPIEPAPIEMSKNAGTSALARSVEPPRGASVRYDLDAT